MRAHRSRIPRRGSTGLKLRHVVVFGAGTMGKGIAQWFAQQGVHVQLVDASREIAEKAYQGICASWRRLVKKGKFTPRDIEAFQGRLEAEDRSSSSLNKGDTDLVLEAVSENFSLKSQLLSEWDREFHPSALFATNTSSFLLAHLSRALSEKRQGRFLGLHFFNPAPLMKLVEVIRSPHTDEALAQGVATWLGNHGKRAALCHDGPGFIVNRVARNFYGEALRLVSEEGESGRFQEIDDALKEVGGFPMGPFELMDFIGIDVNLEATQSIWNAFGRGSRFAPHPLQRRMVEEGRLGRKTGRGFYPYGV